MILNKEIHRKFLLEMIRASQTPGAFLDLAIEIRQAVRDAKVEEPTNNPSIPAKKGEENAKNI